MVSDSAVGLDRACLTGRVLRTEVGSVLTATGKGKWGTGAPDTGECSAVRTSPDKLMVLRAEEDLDSENSISVKRGSGNVGSGLALQTVSLTQPERPHWFEEPVSLGIGQRRELGIGQLGIGQLGLEWTLVRHFKKGEH